MKRILTLIALCIVSGVSASTRQLQIIPQPVKAELRTGVFVTAGCRVEWEGFDIRPENLAALTGRLVKPCHPASTWNGVNAIVLRRDTAAGIPAEGYRIDISARRAQLSAGDDAGLFYGLQTLLQLADERGNLPCVSIEDHPRYRYRGLHLDVCRHFFPVRFIKHYLDWMASCKLNTFHWHLTDDQGWRIEIKRYPRLTEIGYRTRTQIGGFHEDPITYEQGRYGGYYTQDEIREVVAYAAERHIAVIPEIEMPGHATAALAAYPELACGHGPKSFETSGRWGVLDDVFCPGKEQTFEFLEGVLDEVLELFPSKLIHIGGDECPRVRWKECPDCRARMEDEGIEDEAGLQTYLTLRIGRHLEAKGRRLIGWDEILDGELAPGAVVMSWRGTRGGIAAARRRHEVIMTPSTYLYFDKKATDSYDEPVSLSSWKKSTATIRTKGSHPKTGATCWAYRPTCGPNSSEPKGARASSSCRASTRWPKSHGRPSSASRGGNSPRCAFRPTSHGSTPQESLTACPPLWASRTEPQKAKVSPSSSGLRFPAAKSATRSTAPYRRISTVRCPRSSTSRFLAASSGRCAA